MLDGKATFYFNLHLKHFLTTFSFRYSGTGILSMFAAQAGAHHVYGVDSSAIIEQARLVVAKNGFQDKITLIHGKVSAAIIMLDLF